MSKKRAIITGITGQDGAFLADYLLSKGYEIFGVVRRNSLMPKSRIDHLLEVGTYAAKNLQLEYGDLSDGSALRRLLFKVKPVEIYNLAAQSHVRVSFDQAEYTTDVVYTGVVRLLEAARDYLDQTGQEVRFYQASSSEMFGDSPPPQNEKTHFRPRSPYAVAKTAAYWATVNYRDAYGLHANNGILFNHESELRGENFVTRKITRSAGRIKVGLQKRLILGNLDARRDWGYAKDYVHAMWLMLQQDAPDDYVISTGQSHSVREFLSAAFSYLDLDWEEFVEIDKRFFRPTEVDELCGDSSKARKTLGWEPQMTFQELVKQMVDHDLELAEREAHASKFTRRTSLA
jgi:GDPmannose 4,6-dehydratase